MEVDACTGARPQSAPPIAQLQGRPFQRAPAHTGKEDCEMEQFTQRGDTLYRAIPSRREHQFPCCHSAETNGAGERSFRDNRVPFDRGLGQPQSVLSLIAVALHVLLRPVFRGLLRHADVVARASVICTFHPFLQLRLQEIDDVPRKARRAGKLAQNRSIKDTS